MILPRQEPVIVYRMSCSGTALILVILSFSGSYLKTTPSTANFGLDNQPYNRLVSLSNILDLASDLISLEREAYLFVIL